MPGGGNIVKRSEFEASIISGVAVESYKQLNGKVGFLISHFILPDIPVTLLLFL